MKESTEHDGTRDKCDSAGFDESLRRAGAREEGNLPGQRVTQKQDSPERQDSRQTKYLPAILGTLLLLVISCTSPVTLLTPTVNYAPINDGANLHLTWLAVTNATAYNVYVDGVKTEIASGTYSFDVAGPARLIQVSAIATSSESDKWSLTTAVQKTANVTVYTRDDVQQINHAFYFDTTGKAVAIPLSRPSDIDFVLDTSQTITNIELRSPNSYTPKYNTKSNSSAIASGTNIDDLRIAPAAGVYSAVRSISLDSIYSLWLDPGANGWSADDHFAKIKVEGISGTAVTFTVDYQKIPGLRWLISN
jgi:hypothetical protein